MNKKVLFVIATLVCSHGIYADDNDTKTWVKEQASNLFNTAKQDTNKVFNALPDIKDFNYKGAANTIKTKIQKHPLLSTSVASGMLVHLAHTNKLPEKLNESIINTCETVYNLATLAPAFTLSLLNSGLEKGNSTLKTVVNHPGKTVMSTAVAIVLAHHLLLKEEVEETK